MAEPLSDYSKIVELQEIRKLYEDQEERHRTDNAEREAEIQRLRAELAEHTQGATAAGGQVQQMKEEAERLGRQIEVMRQEYEAKIERLNARIRELTATPHAAPPTPDAASKKGFFRR